MTRDVVGVIKHEDYNLYLYVLLYPGVLFNKGGGGGVGGGSSNRVTKLACLFDTDYMGR